jgi:anti-sigma B factor antagonist
MTRDIVSRGSVNSDDLASAACPPAVPFRVRITRAPGWNRLTLEGELDLAASPILEAGLDRLERDPASVIVVDLRRVSFMDASGLHVLVAAHERAVRGRWSLVIVRGPRAVQRLFELAGVDRFLHLLDDPARARPERLLCVS